MSILGKKAIIEEIEKGNIKIEPFDDNMLGPASIDLHLSNAFRVFVHLPTELKLTANMDFKAATKGVLIPEGESLTITAIMTDPDGIQDVIGGTLASEDDTVQYGVFAAQGDEGAYALTITWDTIHQVQPVEFSTEHSRTFVASFFDQDGHRAERVLTITLHCDGLAACSGQCVDLSVDANNCGSCHNAVAPLVCRDGLAACENANLTACDGNCVGLAGDYQHCGSCSNDCDVLTAGLQFDALVQCISGKCTLATKRVAPPTASKSCDEICASLGSLNGATGACVPECTVNLNGDTLYPDESWSSVAPWLYDRVSLHLYYANQQDVELAYDQNCAQLPPSQKTFGGVSYDHVLGSCCCALTP